MRVLEGDYVCCWDDRCGEFFGTVAQIGIFEIEDDLHFCSVLSQKMGLIVVNLTNVLAIEKLGLKHSINKGED